MTAEVRTLQPVRHPSANAPGSDEFVDQIAGRVLAILDARSREAVSAARAADEKLVFVLCSFAPEMDPVYAAIAAAAQRVGLHAERVKDVQGDYRLTETILEMIRRARFVVADLSYERPNVYFELGFARGLDKTVITLLHSGTTVHVDVRDWTYLEYLDSRPLEEDLVERLRYELRPPTATPHGVHPDGR